MLFKVIQLLSQTVESLCHKIALTFASELKSNPVTFLQKNKNGN